MTVQLSVDMRDTASAGLRALMLRVGDIDTVLDEIGGSLVASTQKRFEDEEDPEGASWADWADSTAARRGDGRKLYDETNLFDSLDHKVSGSKVHVGVNMIYGRIHQLGGEAGPITARVVIPARPYLGLSADDKTEVGAIVDDHVRGAGA